ncbi:MAG: beta-lactamase family protein [Alphaproteobacteria bacterium]|nr:beta-lactamase family protein [Alphaproteobacteria bacterium]
MPLRSRPVTAIGGYAEPGFGGVADVFRENFEKRGEVGASVCVHVGGKKVVDLWGGVRDRDTGAAWESDTLQIVFSATKGMVATAFMHLADRGGIDLDAPVAQYWEGFAQQGKEPITVRMLLNHRGGLVAFDAPLSLDAIEAWATGSDPSTVLTALEQQRPLWQPGTAQGYHGVTFGPYAGELFARASGRTLSDYLRDEIFGPLGADVFLGLPESEEPRVSTLYTNGPGTLVGKIIPRVLFSRKVDGRVYRNFLNRNSATRRAFANPPELGLRGVGNFGTRRVRALALPWASAVATARGLSQVYTALASPDPERPLVSKAAIDAVRPRQSWGWDKVLQKPMGFSQGYVKDELHLYSPSPDTFGHPGAGGALGFADPTNGIGFGYVMNRMDFRLRSPRAMALARAVYDSRG